MSAISSGRHCALFFPEQPWFVLRAAQQYSLMMSDNPLISHFYSFTVENTDSLIMAIPDGCLDILFDCDIADPGARVCGSPLQARTFDLVGKHTYFGVRFAPGIVPFFAGLTPEDFPDQEYDISDIMPEATEILDIITPQQTFKDRVLAFNKHFSLRFEHQASPLTLNLLAAIRHHHGNLHINQLEALTGYTSRTIQRQFRHDTGMSPKAFSRIMRCHSALNSLNITGEKSFLDLALELGFSDQPHFQREFKSLISLTPLEYKKQINRQIYSERLQFL